MSLSQVVGAQVPFLRRFARAITGSQASGDAYVTAVLQTLLGDPKGMGAENDLRIMLYRVLLTIINSFPINDRTDFVNGLATGQTRNLDALTRSSRQAFLLCTVEGFSKAQTAGILLVDEAEVSRLIDEASREIAEQLSTDVLIIEDEPLIAEDLSDIVRRLGHRVLAVARTRDEANAIVRDRRPGLILSDIQLADGSLGLDAVKDILKTFDVPVIFITAFPEQLLTGERPEPTFLITKPYDADNVRAMISQALFFDNRAAAEPERLCA